MRIALVGYGKMGRAIERLSPEYKAQVVLRLDEFNNSDYEGITAENLANVDVAIDFTVPDAVVENARRISALGVNLVIGTTGWLDHLDEIRALAERNGTGIVWSPNYSIGVNAFFRIVAEGARLLANQPAYEAWAWEIHHSAKKDAPSGTLLKLVDEMRKSGYGRKVDTGSNRAGSIAGIHEIGFDSAEDTITLRHSARSRDGFARGALHAAQWLNGKTGFHEFADILFE